MQRHYSNQSKYCEWCGSNFIAIKSHQSDMCSICFARLKEYHNAQQLVDKSSKQLEDAKKYLSNIEDKYRDLAKQGYKIPEGLK